jgi:hypothetical protein
MLLVTVVRRLLIADVLVSAKYSVLGMFVKVTEARRMFFIARGGYLLQC